MPVSTGLKYNHEVHGKNKNVEIRVANIGGKFIRFMGGFKNDGQVVG